MDHIEKLIDLYPLKTVSTVLLIFLMDARTVLFLCFALLVVIDCLTRWTAISFKSLAERNGKATLAAALWGIPSARRKGLIRSFDMRKGMDKLLLFQGSVQVRFQPGKLCFRDPVRFLRGKW